MKILNDHQRREYLKNFIDKEKVNQFIKYYSKRLDLIWMEFFGVLPNTTETRAYLFALVEGKLTNTKYSKEHINKITIKFLKESYTNFGSG